MYLICLKKRWVSNISSCETYRKTSSTNFKRVFNYQTPIPSAIASLTHAYGVSCVDETTQRSRELTLVYVYRVSVMYMSVHDALVYKLRMAIEETNSKCGGAASKRKRC